MSVEFPEGRADGMVALIGGLIQANLEAHPERRRLLDRRATFGIAAPDVGAGVWIGLSPGRVVVTSGASLTPDVRIEAPAEALLSMSRIPLRFGVPDLRSPEVRHLLRQLLRREVRVKGALRHGAKLARLAKLLSVG